MAVNLTNSPAAPRSSVAAVSFFMKHQRAQFDALARRSVCRRRLVYERRMRSKSRPTVNSGIVALQKQRFIGCHFREIEPAMVGVVLHRIGFTASIGIDQIGGDKIIAGNSA